MSCPGIVHCGAGYVSLTWKRSKFSVSEDGSVNVKGAYFDTINTIRAWCSTSTLDEALAECQKYSELLSKTVPGSDVWRVNHARGETVTVNEKTMAILRLAQEVSEASGGAFNIAVGPAVELWHFTDGMAVLPDAKALADAVARADFTKIRLEENAIRVPPETLIDLGGIAKGYIADRIADFLRERGVKSAMLNFGGNVVTVGNKPDGSSWKVGLQNPLGRRGEDFWAFVESRDSTVVTSGIYERGFELNGQWYHHILDPRTGWPVQNNLLAVTACAKSSMLADALTTAMFVLGPAEGSQLAEKFDVDVVFLEKNNRVTYTEGLNITFVG
jgi:thiamine biosynthesis lipoprotein